MGNRTKLIIAEDETIIALGMEMFLTAAGYDVCDIVKTADEAVTAAVTVQADLALLDVRLAAGSIGTDAAHRLRWDHGIPSLLVTGHLDADQARACGAIGLLKKPYDPQRLPPLIEAALGWWRHGLVPVPAVPGLFAKPLLTESLLTDPPLIEPVRRRA